MNLPVIPAAPLKDLDAILEFLEYIQKPRPDSLAELLVRLLARSCALAGAEAGVIFIFTRAGGARALEAVSVQAPGAGGGALRLPADEGSIAGYVALSGETVREPEVARIAGRPYRHDTRIDRATGRRPRSTLCFPITNGDGDVIAVVQLFDRREPGSGTTGPFPAEAAGLVPLINRLAGGEVERTMMVDRIRAQNARLRNRSKKLAEQRLHIEELKDQTEEAFRLSISLLARAAEIHDEGTGNHIVRVNEYSYFLAHELGMPAAFCDEIRYSAQLHDVGKIAVDAAVLKKAGSLSAADRAEMNRHPIYGHEILRPSERLQMAAEIALHHHEKWDGSGYPRGLEGEAIPVSARIVQIADVYDALRSPRHYKGAMRHDDAVAVMLTGDDRIDPKGHFDPDLLAVFARCHAGFDVIWRKFADD